MNKFLKMFAVLVVSFIHANTYAEDVCIVDNTPSRAFDARADYQLISDETFAVYVYLEGKTTEYISRLEIYYGVPSDFLWNEDQRLG